MKKRFAGILLSILVCYLAVIPVAAANIEPLWVSANSVLVELAFSGGKANATGIIDGKFYLLFSFWFL